MAELVCHLVVADTIGSVGLLHLQVYAMLLPIVTSFINTDKRIVGLALQVNANNLLECFA